MPIRIVSTGSSLPSLIVSNDNLSEFLDTNDEWISSRSGIKTRHIAVKETTSSMGAEAAKIALKDSGLMPSDIDLVICATLTPDISVPMVAGYIKKELGIENAIAFDMNANCSGFVYALSVAESVMMNLGCRNAIVIGSDTGSQIVDWEDRATCVLFGDGAGAVVLSNTEKGGIVSSSLNGTIDAGEYLLYHNKLDVTPFSEDKREVKTKVSMKGSKVLKFAVQALTKVVDEVLKKANVTIDDVKLIIPHQANERIIGSAAKGMKMDISKFYINIDKVGNTSSGSIPIALDEVARQDILKSGDLIILVAFGGGLSYGAILLEW